MRVFVLFLLIICFGCREKHTQNTILTPTNNNLSHKMKEIGCECIYDEIKNKFFYNKNTGLYFIGIMSDYFIFSEEYKTCMNKLTLNEVRHLYGPPHIENNEYMYYYGNVELCGQYFYGIRLEKSLTKKVINTKNSHDYAYPNDSTKQYNLRCRSTDFLDSSKSKVNQGLFDYFEDDFIDKHFEVATYIKIQPKFENTQVSPRCLENVRFEQNNLLYNTNIKHYIKNWTSSNSAFPLMGYYDGEHKNCTSFLTNLNLIPEIYGDPSYISDDKDTICYVIDNRLDNGKVPTESFFLYRDQNTYVRGPVLLNINYKLPSVKGQCENLP